MAEKPAPKPGVSNADAASRLSVMILTLLAIGFVSMQIGRFVPQSERGENATVVGFIMAFLERTGLLDIFYAVRAPFVFFSLLLSALFIAGILYANRERAAIRKAFTEEMKLVEAKLAGSSQANTNPRWERVLTMASSESPGDWRLAILEADSMLEELMRGMSYHGDTLGEKLKSVEPSDFRTLDAAWEAHKVRNRIAHSGSDFILTARETKRVIELFRKVFEEFDYI